MLLLNEKLMGFVEGYFSKQVAPFLSLSKMKGNELRRNRPISVILVVNSLLCYSPALTA
jgi:hypothetical protein